MPAYSSFVKTMTEATQAARDAGLDSVATMVEHLPKEQQLAVAKEPGMLAAVESFLRLGGNKASTAIDLLLELVEWENNCKLTSTTKKCAAAIWESPCFSSVKDMATTGSTVELKRQAWRVIKDVTCMEEERLKAVLDSPGMVALLQAGLESKDDDIAESAYITTYNLCCNAEVASDMLDSHPDLVKSLVNTFSTSGVCDKFKCKSQPSKLLLSLVLLRFLSF